MPSPPPPGPHRKRPRLRIGTIRPPPTSFGPPLSAPRLKSSQFNVSEIIPHFLHLGAGCEANGPCLVNFPNSLPEHQAARLAFFVEHNITSCLNMAGSPLQKELANMSYPRAVTELAVDVNDVPDWQPGNTERFDQAADFIQSCYVTSVSCKQPRPGVFVHCVAGVNRSPMAVVWWLCKHHHYAPADAWELVCSRRDAGVGWTSQTLGGDPTSSPRREWFEALSRHFAN